MPHALDLTPRPDDRNSEIWTAWTKLQENGVVSYEQDPERNLAVGEREDCTRFSRFCGFSGLVLDVGCGPQPWPAYLSGSASGTVFCGVDPLVGDKPGKYTRVRGLAEYLPFRRGVFSHVVFATTLDHFVSPHAALVEARRVLIPSGTIEVWLGQKAEDTPAPDKSHDWYDQLIKPAGAEDVFHMERLDEVAAINLFDSAGLQVVGKKSYQAGEYRTDNFFRLAAG
jgi:SAM-dependent methyltransferase